MKGLLVFGLSLFFGGLLCIGASFILTSIELILILVGIVATLLGFALLSIFGILQKIRSAHQLVMEARDVIRDSMDERHRF